MYKQKQNTTFHRQQTIYHNDYYETQIISPFKKLSFLSNTR